MVTVLVLSVLLNVVLLWPRGPQIGRWRSRSSRDAYVAAYEKLMAELPPVDRTWDVPTDWGMVHIVRFPGPRTGDPTPILLLPGWGSGIPMWRELLPVLAADRPVYALDALGDAGLSHQSVPIVSSQDQARWISQTLDGIGVSRAHVVGHSFGGWLAANLGYHEPGRVASVTLLDPAQVLSGLRPEVLFEALPAALPFLPQSWRDAALERIGGGPIDPDDTMVQLIDAGTKGYSSARSLPELFSDEQLRGYPVPLHVSLAGDSAVLTDPVVAAARADLLPVGEATVWPGASHSLPMEQPDEVGAAALDFMRRHDG
ncbi:alpha/beta fold hydrolase [Arachnia propionica]|uniref:Alpha/beta fold hydrolase n=2 Tax=Arachnia propionica TaxID=1750 RepID=A0A3P1T795_9ACTN|nr:alpha/beta fold hydrolase [Arachnia propionica]